MNILRSIVFLSALIWGFSCSDSTSIGSNTKDRLSYVDSLIQARKIWNKELKTNPKSPIPTEKREAFVGLNHFAPDSTWIINASIQLIQNPEIIQMATSTERLASMITYAKIVLTIQDKPFELIAFQEVGDTKGELFVPFTDLTSGQETYGGGRYLNLGVSGTDSILVDFNLAYNPYCAYNIAFSCPIPPEENYISIPITAGEKILYH
ncbi:DUF1684 domain-containing protein [bacterium SCSIO 12643]|nr:DUF1684 domain-containing protein [bacterium SCSIO 12643]